MKTLLFIILFCGFAYSQSADTLKLSNGLPLLLNNGQPVLLAGSSSSPTPSAGGWVRGSDGRRWMLSNGKRFLTKAQE